MNTTLLRAWIKKHAPQGATKLAAAAEISPGTLNNILTHKRSPGIEIAKKIAKVVGATMDELCNTDEDEPPGAA